MQISHTNTHTLHWISVFLFCFFSNVDPWKTLYFRPLLTNEPYFNFTPAAQTVRSSQSCVNNVRCNFINWSTGCSSIVDPRLYSTKKRVHLVKFTLLCALFANLKNTFVLMWTQSLSQLQSSTCSSCYSTTSVRMIQIANIRLSKFKII